MTDNPPIEDQILIDLYRWQRSSVNHAKRLIEHQLHAAIIARMVEHGYVQHLGSEFFRITSQGQKFITDKYPELLD